MKDKMEYVKEEVVVCAAVKLNNGDIVMGVRHCDKLMMPNLKEKWKSNPELVKGFIQGFITNKYRFVTREEAAKIAKKQNQIRFNKNTDWLMSENLY